MTILSTSTPIHLNGSGSLSSTAWNDFDILSVSGSSLSFRYTFEGLPVMDIAVTGGFSAGTYDMSGHVSGIEVKDLLTGGSISFTDIYLPFSNLYDFSMKFTVSYLFSGADTVSASSGADEVDARGGDDVVYGNDGDDTLDGNTGNDYLNGNAGNDVVEGKAGNDTVRGGRWSDMVSGGSGDDMVYGDMDADTINGGDGADILHGGKANDWVYGNTGNDTLWGDMGGDALSGGEGSDVFYFAAGSGEDVIADFSAAAGDRIGLVPGVTYTVGETAAGEALIVFSPTDSVVLSGVSPGQVSASWFITL